jgi:hypothetical protein
MLASEIQQTESITTVGRDLCVKAIQNSSVYFRTNGLKEGLLAFMALEEFAKAMTEEVKEQGG